MGSYDGRDKSAYGYVDPDEDECGKSRHIPGWWEEKHDQLLSRLMSGRHWVWDCSLIEDIEAITDEKVLDRWKTMDPLCKERRWHHVLSGFAHSRAKKLGLTKLIRKPEWKQCLLCNQQFVEDSLPYPLVERFGFNSIEYCAPCLRDCVLSGSGNKRMGRRRIVTYLKELTNELGAIPTSQFGEGKKDWEHIQGHERTRLLKILSKKPSADRIKEVFGSWINALIESKIVEKETVRNSRGYVTQALDGHLCNSLGEKSIDDFLYRHDVPHEKEPPYPEGDFRADFRIGITLVEYVGLLGNVSYQAKMKAKASLCRKHSIPLIVIEPRDLVSRSRMETKLLALNQAP